MNGKTATDLLTGYLTALGHDNREGEGRGEQLRSLECRAARRKRHDTEYGSEGASPSPAPFRGRGVTRKPPSR